MVEGIGDRFQRETKYSREALKGGTLDWAAKPDSYKGYAAAKRVDLPPFDEIKTMAVSDALRERRSVRHFTGKPIALPELSYLLWAAGGIQRIERGHEFRTAPSAGALYPIETYLIVDAVEGLPGGLYHYAVRTHALEDLRQGDLLHDLMHAALNQKMCLEAAVVFVWTAVFARSKWKYSERAYRYVYLDAGHIAANLALAATAIGLGSCQIGALFDDEVNRIIEVDGREESVVFMSLVGNPA